MSPRHADGSTQRLGQLMHQLGAAMGPSPEDGVGIEKDRVGDITAGQADCLTLENMNSCIKVHH